MPTYVYEVLDDQGQATGDRFEVVQAMTDDPLTVHPESGQPVRRAFVPFRIAGKLAPMNTDRALKDDAKLEKLGFTKYVKSGDGKYEKVVGTGPNRLNR
ncbi:MAG: FmdB family transcriptional regulator [Pirellulaceae bacterium]